MQQQDGEGDTLDEIMLDFHSLLERREVVVRSMEERLSHNLREETNIVRRLEHQAGINKILSLSRNGFFPTEKISNFRNGLIKVDNF